MLKYRSNKHLNSSAYFFIAVFLGGIIGFFVNLSYGESHSPHAISEQSNFFIDALYYVHLGEYLSHQIQDYTQIFPIVSNESPNPATIGAVLFSTILNFIVSSPEKIGILLAINYAILFYKLRKKNILERGSEFFFISGLLPYLYLPSKEAVFFIGVLIFLFSLPKGTFSSAYVALGLLIMTMGRPEAALIFTISLFISYLLKARFVIKIIFLIFALCAYIFMLREYMIQTGILFEASAELAGTHFCNIGPLEFCLRSGHFPELVFVQRIFVNFFLPFDWFLDFTWLLQNTSSFTLKVVVIRLSAFLHIWIFVCAIIYLVKYLKGNRSPFLIFIVIYFITYSSIFFYQSSRQVMFITLLAFIFSKLSHKYRSQIKKNFVPSPVRPLKSFE